MSEILCRSIYQVQGKYKGGGKGTGNIIPLSKTGLKTLPMHYGFTQDYSPHGRSAEMRLKILKSDGGEITVGGH